MAIKSKSSETETKSLYYHLSELLNCVLQIQPSAQSSTQWLICRDVADSISKYCDGCASLDNWRLENLKNLKN